MSSTVTESENALDAVPDALVGMNQLGVIRFVNQQTESLFGYERDQLIGQRIETLVPESRGWINKRLESYFAQPRTASSGLKLELSGRRQDGTEFPITTSLSYIDIGGVLLAISAVHDVTKQKQAVQNAQFLASIIEHSQDAIVGTTLDRVITSWNPAAERMYGYSRDEIIGKSVGLLIPEDRAAEAKALRAKVAVGQSLAELETSRLHRDGTVFPISLTVSPICDANGSVVGVAAIYRDLTQQMQTAQYTRSLIETALDPMVTITPEGKITDLNEATVKATGVSRNKLIGTSFSNYFTDPKRAEEAYQQVFDQGSVAEYPLTLLHRNAHDYPIEVLYNASVYRDTSGNVIGVVATARDVTKQMQAQREAAEQQAREWHRLQELEHFQQLTVGRELKMIELKKEIEHLKQFAPAEASELDDQS